MNFKDIAHIKIPEGYVKNIAGPQFVWNRAEPGSAGIDFTYFSGLLLDTCTSTITWNLYPAPGYHAYIIGMSYLIASRYDQTFTENSLFYGYKYGSNSYSHTISALEEKNIVKYKLYVAQYIDSDAAADNYESCDIVYSPELVVSGNSVYTLAPYDIQCTNNPSTNTVHVTWKVLPAAVYTKGFQMDVTYDGSTWYRLFWGTCPSLSYDLSYDAGKTKLRFRMSAYSTRSKYESSATVYSPWVTL